MFPNNYKVLSPLFVNRLSGKLIGSAQPGFNSPKEHDTGMLNALEQGKSPQEAGVDAILLSELDTLYESGIRSIYSVAHSPPDRDPNLIKKLWEMKEGAKYFIEIDSIDLSVEDFTAPSVEQLFLIARSALKRIGDGENVLIHCGAGIGRTGTVLAAINMMASNLYDVVQAIKTIREEYHHNSVEAEVQRDMLKKFSVELQRIRISYALENELVSEEEKNKVLILALNLGLTNEISVLIERGADYRVALRYVNSSGKNNALTYSLYQEDTEMALASVESGAEINLTDAKGNSLLNIAVQIADYLLIGKLLKYKSLDINHKNNEGLSPLCHAIKNNDDRLIKLLILNGADLKDIPAALDKIDEYWREALESGNFIAVKNIAEYKPELLKIKINGLYPLKYALGHNQRALYVQMVAAGYNLSKRIPLERARDFISKDPSIIADLLAYNLSLDLFHDSHGKLPQNSKKYWNLKEAEKLLRKAIDNEEINIIRNLWKLELQIDQINFDEQDPISYAISFSKAKVGVELAKAGFKACGSYASKEHNALKLAIDLGLVKEVQSILEKNKLNFTQAFCYECVRGAIKIENLNMVIALAARGLLVKAVDPLLGQTALMYAVEADNSRIIEYISSYSGIDINQADNNSKTALMYAVRAVSPNTISILIRAGADVNLVVEDSNALMEAVLLKKPAILEILIAQHQADPNREVKGGITPLMKATGPVIIRQLLKYGADINGTDNTKKSVMEYLVENNGQGIIKILEEISDPKIDEAIAIYQKKCELIEIERIHNNVMNAASKGNMKSFNDNFSKLISYNNHDFNESIIEFLEEGGYEDFYEAAIKAINERIRFKSLSIDTDVTDPEIESLTSLRDRKMSLSTSSSPTEERFSPGSFDSQKENIIHLFEKSGLVAPITNQEDEKEKFTDKVALKPLKERNKFKT